MSGFLVLGISPDRMERARRGHVQRGAHWNPEVFSLLAIARPARAEAFNDRDEAERFACAARTAGWAAVRVEPAPS